MIKNASGGYAHNGVRGLPPWIRVRLCSDGHYANVKSIIRASGLHTVCEEAHCPNKLECYNSGTATVLILGNICTRSCKFCAVQRGRPLPLDSSEPRRVLEMARSLGLRYVVITSVTRDDLDDGGAAQFAEVIMKLKQLKEAAIEVLTPDFQGQRHPIETVLSAAPHVFNHNLETVRRLQPKVRPQANYDRSLQVLRIASAWHPLISVKSGLMVGLGETDDELLTAIADLYAAGCRSLTLGQYLAPSSRHWPIARFVTPEQFENYRRQALAMGFLAVASGPLVRSSYQAERLMVATRATGVAFKGSI